MRKCVYFALLLAGCDFGISGLDGGGGDMSTGSPSAKITATPDLVGFPTSLSAAESSDPAGRTLTYSWRIVAAPAGSTITDASLSSTSGATVTFEPDLGGDYTVQLTATANGDTNEITAKVTVPTVPIFYQQGTFGASSYEVAVGLMRSDGAGKHLVSCVAGFDGGTKDIFNFGFQTFHGVGAFDPATGNGSGRFAFGLIQGSDHQLLVAAENSECTNQAPPRVDQSDDAFYSTKGHFWPRFSPDGSRVVWVDNPESNGQSRLVTASVDGLNRRVIVGDLTKVNLSTAPPFWIDNTHVGWVQDIGTSGAPKPQIFSALDQANAGEAPTVVADCTANLPVVNEAAMLPNGKLIIAGSPTVAKKNNGLALSLYLVSGTTCVLEQKLIAAMPNGDAGDFSISPDGKTVVVSSTHDNPDAGPLQHDIFTLPSDGSAPATFFAGSPSVDDLGPRFIAGGRQILWTQGSLLSDGGVAGGGLMIANADGTHVRSLYAESNSTVVIAGSNSGLSCSWAGPHVMTGGAALTALFALALALALTRRRSR